MFECAELGCTNRVTHRGQLCGMCSEQFRQDEEFYDDLPENDSAEYLCVKCGERDAIMNNVCGMCSELHPNMV